MTRRSRCRKKTADRGAWRRYRRWLYSVGGDELTIRTVGSRVRGWPRHGNEVPIHRDILELCQSQPGRFLAGPIPECQSASLAAFIAARRS